MIHMPDTHHAPSFAQPTVLNILAPCPLLALPEEDSGNPSRNVVFFQKNQLVYSENVLVIIIIIIIIIILYYFEVVEWSEQLRSVTSVWLGAVFRSVQVRLCASGCKSE